MEHLAGIITMFIPIACGCICPIMVIWFYIRKKINDTNQRTQIVLAVIEKNPEIQKAGGVKEYFRLREKRAVATIKIR